MVCGVVCGVLCSCSVRAGGVLFKTRTQYQGVLGKPTRNSQKMLAVSTNSLLWRQVRRRKEISFGGMGEATGLQSQNVNHQMYTITPGIVFLFFL